jgi:cytochrome c peroxidase
MDLTATNLQLATDLQFATKLQRFARSTVEDVRQATPDLQLAAKGKALFFNRDLSVDGKLSCADCHNPKKGFRDARSQPMARNQVLPLPRTPSLLDVGRRTGPFFWNGRAPNLTAQIFWPLYARTELGATPSHLEKFEGSTEVVNALSAYMTSLGTSTSPWDAYVSGQTNALSPLEIEGAQTFFRSDVCSRCHTGPELGTQILQNYSYSNLPKSVFTKYEVSYAGDADLSKFSGRSKLILWTLVPSVRNLTFRSGPYGRFGQFKTLESYLKDHWVKIGNNENNFVNKKQGLLAFLLVGLRSSAHSN